MNPPDDRPEGTAGVTQYFARRNTGRRGIGIHITQRQDETKATPSQKGG